MNPNYNPCKIKFLSLNSLCLSQSQWVCLSVSLPPTLFLSLPPLLLLISLSSLRVTLIDWMNFPCRWCPLSMRVQCCICSDLFVNNGTDIAATPCGHVFHEHCLARWLISSSTCPSCRKIVIQNAVIPKLFFDIAEEEPGDADPEKLSNELQVGRTFSFHDTLTHTVCC